MAGKKEKKEAHKSGLALYVMLLLSSLKGTLFLFWIVTSYLMCAQIKTEKISTLRKNVCGSMKKKARNRKMVNDMFQHSFWGVQMEKVFFSRKKGEKNGRTFVKCSREFLCGLLSD